MPMSTIKKCNSPLCLKTWKAVRKYLACHLTPIRFSSSGRPIYANEDIKALNIILPDERITVTCPNDV